LVTGSRRADWIWPDNDSCSFRILISPAGRVRGLGAEASQLIIQHAFRTTRLQRIEIEVFAFNAREQHVYERSGFTCEGRRRDAHKIDDDYIDALTMSILRSENQADTPDHQFRAQEMTKGPCNYPHWEPLGNIVQVVHGPDRCDRHDSDLDLWPSLVGVCQSNVGDPARWASKTMVGEPSP